MREIEDVGALAKTYDLAVSGAGPAGMAAEAAAGLGLSTLALDENAGPGGQIYRAVTSTPVRTRATLGEDYWRGAELAASFGASNGDYARAATVWSVGQGFDALERENGLEVAVSRGGSAHLIGAKEVVLAMGALERPFPIPGWILPGRDDGRRCPDRAQELGAGAGGPRGRRRHRPAPPAPDAAAARRRRCHRGAARHPLLAPIGGEPFGTCRPSPARLISARA